MNAVDGSSEINGFDDRCVDKGYVSWLRHPGVVVVIVVVSIMVIGHTFVHR